MNYSSMQVCPPSHILPHCFFVALVHHRLVENKSKFTVLDRPSCLGKRLCGKGRHTYARTLRDSPKKDKTPHNSKLKVKIKILSDET